MSEKYKGFTEELEVRKQQFYELDGKKLFPNKKFSIFNNSEKFSFKGMRNSQL